ncbi:MAG: helix-turn-helix domain-containing protein [Clostridia bacterium]|nr:helix-turn-helix domain-containing protein [Clostridia bacterium]
MSTMGEIIKTLRKQAELTQEELAEKVGVTAQAISKWENNIGMPDISQVVPLVSVFGVSTDVLFGLNPNGIENAIENTKKITELPETTNDKSIELWEQLLKSYPRNNTIRFELAQVYSCRKKKEDYIAAIGLLEKILDECTDSELRWKSIDNLCFCYSRIGDIKNAIRVANLLPPIHISSIAQLADIDEYEKRNEVNQELLSYCIEEAAWCLVRQSYSTDENAVFAYRTAI